jgi:HAD superfamily hydrolase (TIGR01490 family)
MTLENMPLSIFDLDRTLTMRGTWSPFLLFAARRRAPWRLLFVPAVIVMMAAYKLRLVSRKQLKEHMQSMMMGSKILRANILTLAAQYADECLAKNIYRDGLALILSEQSRGRRVIIASAAHSFYLEAIAQRIGVEHIGTNSVWHRGALLPLIDGENCYGTAKRDRIIQYLEHKGIDRDAIDVRFFSDDMSDLPTFIWADEAVAVNPSARLAQYAIRQGWCIYNWRQSNGMRTALSAVSQPVKQIEIGISRLGHVMPVRDSHS